MKLPVKKNHLLPIVCIVFALSACLSPWKGEEASVTLRLGSAQEETGRAAAWPPDEKIVERLTHTVVFSGPRGRVTQRAPAGVSTVQAVIAVGRWNIEVDAFLDGEPYAKGSAIGVEIKAGQNNTVPITMFSGTYVTLDFNFDKSVPLRSDTSPANLRYLAILISADELYPGYPGTLYLDFEPGDLANVKDIKINEVSRSGSRIPADSGKYWILASAYDDLPPGAVDLSSLLGDYGPEPIAFTCEKVDIKKGPNAFNLTLYSPGDFLTTIEEIEAYLALSGTGPGSSDLRVALDLGDMTNGNWPRLLDAIGIYAGAGSGNNVYLDLSRCSMTGTSFNPIYGSMGKDRINSLVLPNAATSIVPSAFSSYTKLEYIKATRVTNIGDNAFDNGNPNDLYIVLGPTPPTLGTNLFNSFSSSKTVIVEIPSGAGGVYGVAPAANDTTTVCWGNGFRGGGWNGSSMPNPSNVNNNITLEFKTY